ncbi:MAG: GMC family oxidoreductase [Actinomycetota bacterium]|nr:GMC family oxidoreductase [Actinomycetota bacterium]
MLIDGRQIDDGARLTSDLVVVGAGPAGISIVDRLRGSGLSICLIDGGGFSPDLRSQRLFRGESIGTPYYRLDACRYRQFGGSSNHWGGWCRPLDPIDFAQRDWLPWSGWPIEAAELEPFYSDAAELLQLPTARFNAAAWPPGMPPPLEMPSANFESAIIQFSPETNFGLAYRDRIVHGDGVTLLLRANVTELLTDPEGRRIEGVSVRTLTGRSFRVDGRAVVLAAGAIENARLLLLSRRARRAGVGNEHDLVGRFFMEHLHVPAGHLRADERPINRDFHRKAVYDGRHVRGLLAATADAQARHRLLACSIGIEDRAYVYGTPFIEWHPVLRTAPARAYLHLRRVNEAAAAKVKGGADRAWNTVRMAETWRLARAARARDAATSGSKRGQLLSLYARAEQAPDPSSRISLSDRKDALGLPQPRLAWRVREVDTASILGWVAQLDADVRRLSVGHVIGPEAGWEEKIIGGPHHMGTTRMSADPSTGVVDRQCRVHSVENLYLAGSSVFATGGYANPTFTLVALALRLADELKRSLTATA